MSLTRAQLERKGVQMEAAQNADQAEWKAVRLGTAPIDEGVRDERIAESATDLPGDELSSVGGTEIRLERFSSETSAEIERRVKLMGAAYPFEVDRATLRHVPSATKVYEFCLAISFVPTISKKPYVRLQIGFERLLRDLMKQFFGDGAQGFRTGHPGDKHEFRPTRIKAVIEHLASLAGEWVWHPDADLPEDPSYKTQKDLGLDVVVWKKLPDLRKGYICCVGQCACGLTDWESKFHDITLDSLSSWIKPPGVVPPTRMFAVPFHIPNDPYFGLVSRKAGLTLDRARIAMLAERPENQQAIHDGAFEKYGDLVQIVLDAPVVELRGRRRRRRKGEAARRSRSTGSGASPNAI